LLGVPALWLGAFGVFVQACTDFCVAGLIALGNHRLQTLGVKLLFSPECLGG